METKVFLQDDLLLHDDLCEQQVIGVLLQSSIYLDAYRESNEFITEDAFFREINRYIYFCIGEIVNEGDIPDLTSVAAYIQKHPKKGIDILPYYLAECSSSVVSSVTFSQNCQRLADLHKHRSLYYIGNELETAGMSEINDPDEIKAVAITKLQSIDDTPQTSIKTAEEAIKDLDNIVMANIKGTHSICIPTGFQFIDSKGGLQETDLWVIAAEFSQGKTSLAMDICINASMSGFPCVFYSTEMMSTQLMARILAGRSGLSSKTILQQPLQGDDLKKYDKAIGEVEKLPIYFDDTSTLSVERIISSIRSLSKKKGVKVAFIDYLQVLQTNEKNMNRTEEQFFGLAARKFKNLAKELQICIVLISQIARSRDTTEPTLSRIRGSGQITEAADVVLLIYRPECYGKHYSSNYANVSTKGTAQIKLAKGRNIGTGEFICGYDAPTTHFYELTTIPHCKDGDNVIDEDRPF